MLKLNKELFSKNIIDKAIIDYKDVCKIDFEETDDYWVCKFTNIDEKYIDLTKKEFENYLIFLLGSHNDSN